MASRLGKGLGAIFGENTYLDEEKQENEQIIHVEIKDLKKNPYQPRKKFDEAKIAELAQSIAENGVLQPIIVTKISNEHGYYIVAGERRTRACEKLGLETIPAIVRDIPNRAMAEIALLENLQRENLSVIEEAKAYAYLLNEYTLTQQDLADKVGKSRTHITNMMRLLALPSKVQEYLDAGTLEFGAAKVLAGLDDAELITLLAEKTVSDNLSVRALEQLIKSAEKGKPAKKEVPRNVHLEYLEEKLMLKLGTSLKITSGEKGGKLVIDYNSETDLNRILKIMNLEDITNLD